MSRGYTWLVRHLLKLPFHDTETGYKFFRRERLLPLLDETLDPGWFWDTEVMARALYRGLEIVEVPGAFIRRYDKTSTVSGIRDSFRYLVRMLAFRKVLAELRR